MARRDDGAQIGQRAPQLAVRIGDDLVLAVVRAGGDQQRAAVERGPQALELGAVDRRRRRVDLEIAGGDGARRAERGEAAGQALVLRQHQREAAEQRLRDAQVAPPAPERALGHARVDERQRNAARRAFQDQVGPDLRLGEDREVRAASDRESSARTRAHRAARIDGRRAGPRRWAASLAEVTVPVVSRNESDGRRSASAEISGRMALVSPTLAAWNQARRPAGRATLGWPSRSSRRAGSSLPCRSRKPSSSGATGRARLVSVR